MNKTEMDRLAEQFHKDTDCYAPGYIPEPETRVGAEEKFHAGMWHAWCKGRERGLTK